MKPVCRGAVDWRIGLLGTILLIAAAGCQSNSSHTEAPPNWETENGRWWQTGVDTALAMQSFETFQEMGIPYEEIAFEAGRLPEQQPVRMKRRVINDVKRELLPLYRHRPEVVDSLFEELVVPEIRNNQAPSQADFDETVERQKERAYQTLRQYFTEPRTRLTLGEDVPIAYPDSLRSQGTGGQVRMQVYLNDQGEPQAVEILEGVHPVLDKIALRAATQMRWEPAKLDGLPIRSWVRYSIHFTP